METKDLSDMQMERDAKRREAINRAVEAAQDIISEASDGSEEETEWFTAQVAMELMTRAVIPFARRIESHDMVEDGKFRTRKTDGQYVGDVLVGGREDEVDV